METHNFLDDAKIRRFCLTLMGEARLLYESLGTTQLDWAALQEHFDSSIQNLVAPENSIFMFGDLSILMRMLAQ